MALTGHVCIRCPKRKERIPNVCHGGKHAFSVVKRSFYRFWEGKGPPECPLGVQVTRVGLGVVPECVCRMPSPNTAFVPRVRREDPCPRRVPLLIEMWGSCWLPREFGHGSAL